MPPQYCYEVWTSEGPAAVSSDNRKSTKVHVAKTIFRLFMLCCPTNSPLTAYQLVFNSHEFQNYYVGFITASWTADYNWAGLSGFVSRSATAGGVYIKWCHVGCVHFQSPCWDETDFGSLPYQSFWLMCTGARNALMNSETEFYKKLCVVNCCWGPWTLTLRWLAQKICSVLDIWSFRDECHCVMISSGRSKDMAMSINGQRWTEVRILGQWSEISKYVGATRLSCCCCRYGTFAVSKNTVLDLKLYLPENVHKDNFESALLVTRHAFALSWGKLWL